MITHTELSSLQSKLNATCAQAFDQALVFCQNKTHFTLEIEHFLLKLCMQVDNDCALIMKKFDLDIQLVMRQLQGSIDQLQRGNYSTPLTSTHMLLLFQAAWSVSSLHLQAEVIRSGAILIALLENEPLRTHLLEHCPLLLRINALALKENFAHYTHGSAEVGQERAHQYKAAGPPPHQDCSFDDLFIETPMVDDFSLHHRDEELRRLITFAQSVGHNPIVITGESGTGRTSLLNAFKSHVSPDATCFFLDISALYTQNNLDTLLGRLKHFTTHLTPGQKTFLLVDGLEWLDPPLQRKLINAITKYRDRLTLIITCTPTTLRQIQATPIPHNDELTIIRLDPITGTALARILDDWLAYKKITSWSPSAKAWLVHYAERHFSIHLPGKLLQLANDIVAFYRGSSAIPIKKDEVLANVKMLKQILASPAPKPALCQTLIGQLETLLSPLPDYTPLIKAFEALAQRPTTQPNLFDQSPISEDVEKLEALLEALLSDPTTEVSETDLQTAFTHLYQPDTSQRKLQDVVASVQSIISQEEAIVSLASCLMNEFNVLPVCAGPDGSGKRTTIETLASRLDFPIPTIIKTGHLEGLLEGMTPKFLVVKLDASLTTPAQDLLLQKIQNHEIKVVLMWSISPAADEPENSFLMSRFNELSHIIGPQLAHIARIIRFRERTAQDIAKILEQLTMVMIHELNLDHTILAQVHPDIQKLAGEIFAQTPAHYPILFAFNNVLLPKIQSYLLHPVTISPVTTDVVRKHIGKHLAKAS